MYLTYIKVTSLSINHNNNNHNVQSNHNTGYTWFTPVWGYVHQIFFFFIVLCQYSYMHRASYPTLHRTRDLWHLTKSSFPELGPTTKPFLQSLSLNSTSSQHTTCTELARSHRSNYLHHLHLAQHHTTT
jgi:hypothetical protein